MDKPVIRNDLKSRLLRLVKTDESDAGAAVAGSDGQDRTITQKPLWKRYWKHAAAALVIGAGAAWLLAGKGGNVYRAPINQLTIGTVTEGRFDDYIAVRGAVAPFLTAYLTTDQGGTVKQVLVEDGAMVKAGQPLFDVVDPIGGGRTVVASHLDGVFYMGRDVRFVKPGDPVGRVSGERAFREGKLLGA